MMLNTLFSKVRSAILASPLLDWWADLRFYWQARDKGHLVFFSVLGMVVTALAGAIYYSITESMDRRNLTCLALNIYYEARSEPDAGQRAVAQVTMNRVASDRYPDTVCAAVYQKNWDRLRRRHVGAFSWTELESKAKLEPKAWQHAWKSAEAVYYKRVVPDLEGALFYHADYIKPSWARKKKPVAKIGNHIFYK